MPPFLLSLLRLASLCTYALGDVPADLGAMAANSGADANTPRPSAEFHTKQLVQQDVQQRAVGPVAALQASAKGPLRPRAIDEALAIDEILSPLPRQMTFVQAVEAGLAYQLQSALADTEVHRARGVGREVLAQALPTLSANGTYSHIDHARTLAGRTLQPDMQLNGNVALMVPLVHGRAWGNIAEARAGVAWAEQLRQSTRRQVAINVAYGYLDAIAQAQAAQVLVHSVALNKGHFNYAKDRFLGGVGNRLDMLRADQELATSQVQCRRAQVAAVQAEETLGRLVGYNGPVQPVDEVLLPEAHVHAEALVTLHKRRADLRAALCEVLWGQRVRKNSYLDFLPTLLASGQIFGQAPPSPTVPNFGWQVQLVLSVPLYDGGARDGRRAQRRSQEQMAMLRLDDATRRAKSEVRVALWAAESAEMALVEATRASTQAASALELALQAYKRGLSQNLEVIDAERRAADTATAAVVARNALRRAQVELVAAAGQFPGPL